MRGLEREILSIAQKWHIRFVGPNCISIINLENGLVLPFVPLDPTKIKAGSLSLVSQSGGIVTNSLKLLSCGNIGFNKLISIGNKLNYFAKPLPLVNRSEIQLDPLFSKYNR